MRQEKKTCLSCKFFRLDDVHSGVCRVEKDGAAYPMKLHGDVCERWQACGQQYYIRTGWIKSRLATLKEKEKGS